MFTLSFSWGSADRESARALIDAARNEADENCLPSCLVWKRCAVNPNIQDDELTAIESNRQQVMESWIRQAGVWMPCV